MLFCVKITNELSWGNESVSSYDYTIWEAENEDSIHEDSWEQQCGAAGACDEDEDWDEHVNSSVSCIVVPYDPTNHEHALCRSEWNLSVERPEHEVAVAAQAALELANQIKRTKLAIDRKVALIARETAELEELMNELITQQRTRLTISH